MVRGEDTVRRWANEGGRKREGEGRGREREKDRPTVMGAGGRSTTGEWRSVTSRVLVQMHKG
ncbi:hypothetical protein ACLOJK_027331, partial [Asimina triloba]